MVIRIHVSKKNRQRNGQKKKYKRTRRVWRYQRGNQNPCIEEEQTTQWPRSLVLCICFVDRCLSFCFFFFWPLCCLFFFDTWVLITPLVSSNYRQYNDPMKEDQHTLKIEQKEPYKKTWVNLGRIISSFSTSGARRIKLVKSWNSDYPFGIFKLFLSFCTFSFGHCVVCSSSIHGFWLPLWYLQTLLVLLYFFFIYD
jgi:hypothetical protein